jgi:hypothetical protein
MKHIKTFEGFLNEADMKNAAVDTKGDSMPGMSVMQSKVNNGDVTDVKVQTSFYHNGTIEKSKEKAFINNLTKDFTDSFQKTIKKFEAPSNGSGKLFNEPHITVIQKKINGTDTVLVNIEGYISYSGFVSNPKKFLEVLQKDFSNIFTENVENYK